MNYSTPTVAHLKILRRRYNAWCNWEAKFEAYWAAYCAESPKLEDGTTDYEAIQNGQFTCSVQYPKGRPSKNSKYAAYEACAYFRNNCAVHVDAEDVGSVREWRACLVQMDVRPVKPLPACNERPAPVVVVADSHTNFLAALGC